MSWDNVKGVSAAKIWIDNPDTTQAYLFANGNHQVKLTVGISFVPVTASDPSVPTEDEVKAALTLIDYQTGAGLSHLKEGDKGEYTYIYQPNLPVEVKSIAASESIVYQYEFDYYISSDSTINNNYASEQVALLISPPNIVPYSTDSSSKSQSYVAVTVYSPKKYGMPQSNMTPIMLYEYDTRPHYTINDYDMVTSDDVKYLVIYAVKIDDPYCRITHFEAPDTALSPSAFRQIIISYENSASIYGYHLVQGYLPTENDVNRKNYSYTTTLGISVDASNGKANVAEYRADVYQMPGVIIFTNVEVDIQWEVASSAGDLVKSSDSAKLTVFDQFGNQANIEVGAGDDYALTLSSVT